MGLLSGREIIRYFDGLVGLRQLYESQWRDIADHIKGRRQFPQEAHTPGQERHARIYDNTGLQSGDMLASSLHNFLTNTATLWFRAKPEDEDLLELPGVPEWFDVVNDRMNAAFNRPDARFVPAMHEVYVDLVFFCTACLFVESVPGIPVRYSAVPLSLLWVAEGPDGKVDTVFRRKDLTNRQAVAKWGDAAVRANLRLETDANESRQYIHFVHRSNDPALLGQRVRTRKPWRSVWIDRDSFDIVSEGGFDEMPYMVARWEKEPGETYGRGPGWTALPDAKMLNAMAKTLIKAAQKAADPPLIVADDGVILPLDTSPGATMVRRAASFQQDPIVPLPVATNLPITVDFYRDRQSTVRGAFLHDLLLILQKQFETATQVVEIIEQAQALLSPMIGRFQNEMLEPVTDRHFGILSRSGAFPPAPPAIQGVEIKTEYVSPVQRAQQLSETRAVVDTTRQIGEISALDPTILDNLDLDAVARRIGRGTSAPADIIRDAQQVANRRAAQQELAREQQELEEAAIAAGAAGRAAPALKAIQGGV